MNVLEARTEGQNPTGEKFIRQLEFAAYPLQSLVLTFYTTDDNKDHDTSVSVSIDNHAVLMGSGNVGGGQEWGDGSTVPAGIPVANGVDYYDAGQGHVNITMHPNGDDEWHFNVRLDMVFAAGGRRWVTWEGINLAEDRPSVDLNWV